MAKIIAVSGRLVYDSRGGQTVEYDVILDGGHSSRVAAPSGASVGKNEVASFKDGIPSATLMEMAQNSGKLMGLNASDPRQIRHALKKMDGTNNYSGIGGAAAFAISIAAADAAAKSEGKTLFGSLTRSKPPRCPVPLGNILGGGAHAGPGTPDIQEVLVCARNADAVMKAAEINFAIHKELQRVLVAKDPNFTNGRGDEGGWAPKLGNEDALEAAAKACENLGYTLGKEVALGVDFASSTQWDAEKKSYVYERAGITNSESGQVDFAAGLIEKFKLIYAEDAVHEEAFSEMAELTAKFPNVMITGDDLTVTNRSILERAIKAKSCNAAILKVNQAGCLQDALEFAELANRNKIKLVTSHRSGESIDSHIVHIGIATGSRMLKVGVVGGERVAKLNELLRLAEHGLICGMAEV